MVARRLLFLPLALSVAAPAVAQCDLQPAPRPQPGAGRPPPPPFIGCDPFLFFFESGSIELNGPARAVLANVVTAFGSGPGQRIRITGHSDSPGEADYNLRLSRRRAAATAEYLRNRLPGVSIETNACGELLPLVATPDGIGEAQNRRVEICDGRF